MDSSAYARTSPSYLGYKNLSPSKSWTAKASATKSRMNTSAMTTFDNNSCPFTRDQLDQYRVRINAGKSRKGDDEEFTKAHNTVYQEILNKLPSSKHENDQNVLTDYEK